MKITYNAVKKERKRLANAIARQLAVASAYIGPPSYAFQIGDYIVDKDGNLVTPDTANKDDVFRLVDALYAEYEFKPAEPLHELFPEEETDESEILGVPIPPEELVPYADNASEVLGAPVDDEEEPENIGVPVEEHDEEDLPADEPQNAPTSAGSSEDEPAIEAAAESPENGAETSDEADPSAKDETRLTLSLPRDKFSAEAIERLRALVSSKQSLLKKVLNTDDLTIVTDEKQIMFPWFTLQGIDGEVDAYSKLIFLMARRALASSRISATEKPTDNDKFTMRLFLNNLGFKGEEFKFARRFLVRNLEGNGAWRHGNAPDTSGFDLDMPTVMTPNANTPVRNPVDRTDQPPLKEEPKEDDVGDEEEESTDEG